MKIAVLDDYAGAVATLDCFSLLAGHYVDIVSDVAPPLEVLAQRLADREVLVLLRERTVVGAELLDRLPRLRMLTLSGPYRHVDVAACTRAGVLVCHGPQRPTWATAELALGLMLAAWRHIPGETARLRAGGWQHTVGRGLRGRTLGVWGYGKIGSQVAALGRAFGMRVLVWSRQGGLERARAQGYDTAPSRDALCGESDVLSLHLRLTPETRGIVDARVFAAMKREALFVNVSRAELVAPGALAAALRAGRPAQAAVDVYEREPVVGAGHELLHLDNALCTPHLGYATRERLEGYYIDQVERVLAYAAGQPTGVLNPEVLAAGAGRG
jgi:D-3-phosphoglycerate dehydrogenase